MERDRIAEWILSLALPAERAAAVTGDFLEEARERGGFWFWSSVLRTVAGCIWCDVRECPRELISLGVREYFMNLIAMFFYVFVLVLVSSPVVWLMGWVLHRQTPPLEWGWPAGLLAIWFAARRTGRSLSRRVPDRKLAACVVFFFVSQLVPIALGIVIEQFWAPSSSQLPSFSWMDSVVPPVFWAALIYGALKSDGRKPIAHH